VLEVHILNTATPLAACAHRSLKSSPGKEGLFQQESENCGGG